jgi:phosphotransacetylase
LQRERQPLRAEIGASDETLATHSDCLRPLLALMTGRSFGSAAVQAPLAFDNAVSTEAAMAKGIVSPFAGHADVLVVPDLETSDMLAKQLEYLCGAEIAGIVLGARVPVVLTSRADKTSARLAASAIALLLARRK